MMTDPVADLLTRIRNALRVRRPKLEVPHSGLREAVVSVLKREGFVRDFQVVEGAPRARLRIQLRYGPRGESAINEITRVSVPGRRIYRRISEVPPIAGGIGIAVLSTSRGVLSDREARKSRVGGELLCTVW